MYNRAATHLLWHWQYADAEETAFHYLLSIYLLHVLRPVRVPNFPVHSVLSRTIGFRKVKVRHSGIPGQAFWWTGIVGGSCTVFLIDGHNRFRAVAPTALG